MFVHKSSSYLTAKIANCAVEKQRDVILFFCGRNVVKRMKFIRECQRNVVNNNSRCLLFKATVLFHNNARPNSAAATAETISSTNLNPLHTPHTIPIQFHAVNTCYGPLKETLRGRKFEINYKIKDTMHTQLRTQWKVYRRWFQKACEPLHTVR